MDPGDCGGTGMSSNGMWEGGEWKLEKANVGKSYKMVKVCGL